MIDTLRYVAVVIPAYNAESSLGTLLRKLLALIPARNILVVDDGSTDNTGNLARQFGVRLLSHPGNRGKGKALSTGFAVLAREHEFDAVATIDADLQHRPEDLELFVERMKSTSADVVIGRRNRAATSMPIHRKMSNSITSFLVSARAGAAIPDSQCGFRLIRREVLAAVSINSDGFEAETEFLIKCARKGYRIEFVPIETIYNGETSHMRNWTTIVSFVHTILREF
jgi:glycosyltransferase involved in cell wall biosynthesis